MEIITTTIHTINWEFPDAQDFSTELINGKITMLDFRDIGNLTTSSLNSTNEKYLRCIYKALDELFQQLDKFRGIKTETIEKQESVVDSTQENRFHLQHSKIG